jgi:hypothetical protein
MWKEMRMRSRLTGWAVLLAFLSLAIVAPRAPADVSTPISHAYCALSTAKTYFILLESVDANRDGKLDYMFDAWSPVSRLHGDHHLNPPVYTDKPSTTVRERCVATWVGVANKLAAITDVTVEKRSDGTGWFKVVAYRNVNGARGAVIYQMPSFARLFMCDLEAL